MSPETDSSDRGPGDYILFTVAFLGFLAALAGIILSATPLALVGALVWVGAVLSFRLHRAPDH